VHKRFIDIFDINPNLLEALRTLNLPAGVEIEIKM
jgi:ribosomal protein S10